MNPLILYILSLSLILVGVAIGTFIQEKYSLIVGSNFISTGLLGLFIATAM